MLIQANKALFHVASITAKVLFCLSPAMRYSDIAQGICRNVTRSLVPYCRFAAVGTFSA